MGRPFRLRDPVHGFIQLHADEVKLIDTPIFQRLRRIRQLAMASLVYPGAVHTRFDHSLGVCHVAGMLAAELGLDSDEVRLVRLAALLHDLGHGPFSHVSEPLLERHADRSRLPAEQKKEKIHELITAHFIRTDPALAMRAGPARGEEIAHLLLAEFGQPALKNIVSGPLDADKQDYLLRDSRFCGVAYGLFDIHQLHRSLVLYGAEDHQQLMIRPDGVHATEQYVLAKYYLTTMVYRHRVRLITDQMIVRALTLGIEVDQIEQLRCLYFFDGSDEFFENYKQWDDERLLLACTSAELAHTACAQLMGRLLDRRLLKRVFLARIGREEDSALREVLGNLPKPEHSARRSEIETEAARLLAKVTRQQVDKRFVIVHVFDIKSVRTTSRNDEAGILVATAPQPRPFEQESTLFASINEEYDDQFVEMYAPVEWETHTARDRLLETLRRPMEELIRAACTGVKGETL